ncbi:MAG: InlB B-repeat-containing protein [Roseburia sp.]|nr:InlB B-repeat-containing protein [Roseburia sp.]
MKFKKLFLSTIMLCGIALVGGGLTTHAEDEAPKELTENFSFTEEFDYGDGSISAYGGANNHNLYANSKQDLVITTLEQKDNLEVLKVSTMANASQTGKISIRDNGSASSLFNKENSSMVLKFKFNIDHGREQQFGLWLNTADIGSSRTYTLLRMRDDGTYYQIPEGQWIKMETLTARVSKNEWHEATFILENNGGLDGTASQDKIYGFLDNKFIYETNFANNDDFNGKLTEFFYNIPNGNTSQDINMYLDYVRIGEYNAPVVSAPLVSSAKVGASLKLDPIYAGTDTNYLPSICPNYNVTFSLNGTDLLATTENNTTTYSLEGEDIISYESGYFTGLKAVENLTINYSFDGNLAEPVSTTFSIEENVEPILVADILTEKVVVDNTITLGVSESFALNKLFKAFPNNADNTDLAFEVVEGNDVVSLNNDILTALKTGTAKLKISATDDSGVEKEVDVKVTQGAYSNLNNYELTDVWNAAEEEKSGFTSKGYGSKTFAEISVVSDDVFGKAIKIAGNGGANPSGSHLDKWIPLSELSENKDFKLTGWIKMNPEAASKTSASRIDLKIFTYYNTSNGNITYGSAAPYAVTLQNDKGKLTNGWVYFETNPINLDVNAIGKGFEGIKVEIGTWNQEADIDAYVTHLSLVELESVKTESWNFVNDKNQAVDTSKEIVKKTNETYQINVVPIPSTGTISPEFTSSDETLATVNEAGLVTILDKTGDVTITVKVGLDEKTIQIKITKPVETISIDTNPITIILHDFNPKKAIWSLNVVPADATSELASVVADETICKAELDGNQLYITEVALGTTTITITASDNPAATLEITVIVKEYNVTYDMQGHGTAPQAESNVVALPAELPNATADGYLFEGWYLEDTYTTKAVAGAAITANTTLYAKWVPVSVTTYTITFNTKGHGTAQASVTGTKLPTLPVLAETGYTFEGWYLDDACTQKAVEGKEITADTTLYAKWTPKAVTPPVTDKTNKGLSGGAIAGIVIGVIAALGLAGGLAFYFIKKNHTPKEVENKEDKE